MGKSGRVQVDDACCFGLSFFYLKNKLKALFGGEVCIVYARLPYNFTQEQENN